MLRSSAAAAILGAMMRSRHFAMLPVLALAACSTGAPAPAGTHAQYLYLWTASDDATQPDFLAVLDVTESGSRYGRLVTTLPVPGRGNEPHHTEHEMPADGQLFANGFGSGQSFVFDLTDPTQPRVVSQFGDVEGYTHPHRSCGCRTATCWLLSRCATKRPR